MMPPKLSIVTGTLDRLPLLMRCLDSVRAACAGLAFELIVVDGGSVDGTAEFLQEQPDVRVVWQGRRLGAVAAFNAGFELASGEYVANLNDDCTVRGGVLRAACQLLDQDSKVGQVAIAFADPRHSPAVHYVTVGTPDRAWLYANFGVTRRELGRRLGWWGDFFHHYGGDTELSLQVWKAGFRVEPLPAPSADYCIAHVRANDATRLPNDGEGRALGRRWRAWDGKPDGEIRRDH